MITNPIKPKDFHNAGIELLNSPWQSTIIQFKILDDARAIGALNASKRKQFWKSTRRTILSALTQIVQGAELLIKERIANVSPFLLIEKITSEGKDVNKDFSDFKTIQESDLILVHNRVVKNQLDSGLETKFKNLLKIRNKIIHSEILDFKTPSEIRKRCIDNLFDIAFISVSLFPQKTWFTIREECLKDSTEYILNPHEYAAKYDVLEEFKYVLKYFNTDQVGKALHISKSSKKYYCANCFESAHGVPEVFEEQGYKFAVKDAKKKGYIYCPVCGGEYEYDQYPCVTNRCKGAVHFYGTCLCCLDNN